MRKLLVLSALSLFSLAISAQEEKRELDLATAVMEQYRSLSPDDVKGFHWIETDRYIHYGEEGEILVRNFGGDTLHTLSLSNLNERLRGIGIDTLRSLRVMDVDGNTLFLSGSNSIYSVEVNGKNPGLVGRYPEKASNLEFHAASRRMAYTIDNNVFIKAPGNEAFQVTKHTPESDISAGIAIHRSEFGIHKGLFWSKDGSKLGFYEMDESEVTDYPLANYTSFPGEVVPIKYPMAGQTSHLARAGVFDIATKATAYLEVEGPRDQYLTNFAFSPDATEVYLAIVNRDQTRMELRSFHSASGKPKRTLFEERNEKYVEPEHPPIFINEGERFIWFSEKDGFNNLYLFDSEGNQLKQLTVGAYDVLDVIGVTKNGKTAIVKVADGNLDEALLTVRIPSGRVNRITDEGGIYSADFNPLSELLLIRHKSMSVPNRVYMANLKGEGIRTILEAGDPLKNYEMGEVELPVLQTDDGVELQARIIKPFDFDPTLKYPVLVYVYGGPHAQLIKNTSTGGAPLWMFYAANRGYIVFTVDNRGSAGRGLKFEQSTFRQLGTIEMQDQLVGVEYLKTLPYVDSSKMAVHGWSFGGFMTTSLMLRKPGIFKVGVAGGPVTDWSLYEIMYTERYMDTPSSNPEGFKSSDLKNYVHNLEGDLLLIHGLDDDVVVPQHSYTLLEAFISAGKQVDFFVYPGHKHNVRGKDRVHLMEKVLNYIDLHLKK